MITLSPHLPSLAPDACCLQDRADRSDAAMPWCPWKHGQVAAQKCLDLDCPQPCAARGPAALAVAEALRAAKAVTPGGGLHRCAACPRLTRALVCAKCRDLAPRECAWCGRRFKPTSRRDARTCSPACAGKLRYCNERGSRGVAPGRVFNFGRI